MRRKIIGLTGGSGAGKSTAARLLGGVVITSDEVYHELLKTNKNLQNELLEKFGTYERSELRKKVFGDSNKDNLKDLEQITHKYIVEGIKKRITELADEKLIIIDAAIVLVKTDLHKICDKLIAVMADRAVRVYRTMARDGLENSVVEARINAQPKDEIYLDKADAVVYNNGRIEDIVKELKKIIKEK